MAEANEEEGTAGVEYNLLTGYDKSAILLSSLGHSAIKLIFKHLKDNDVKKLISTMSSVSQVPIWVVRKVLEEFFIALSEESDLLFTDNKGKDFILSTLGEERARQLLGQVVDIGDVHTLESLEMVDTRTLSNFLLNEHPQTIALIVAHLPPEKKVEVLKRLSEAIQAEVVLRIANLDFVSPDLISQLDDVLKTELSILGSIDTNQIGGVPPIADMLNLMDKATEKGIISKVEEKDPELAEEIKKLMFVFEDLLHVDNQGIQELLKKVDNQKLVISLKTAPEEVKQKLLKNMSSRASQMLQEDIASLGPMKLSDVEKAQQEMIQIVKDLEAKGKAIINRGGSGDQLV